MYAYSDIYDLTENPRNENIDKKEVRSHNFIVYLHKNDSALGGDYIYH